MYIQSIIACTEYHSMYKGQQSMIAYAYAATSTTICLSNDNLLHSKNILYKHRGPKFAELYHSSLLGPALADQHHCVTTYYLAGQNRLMSLAELQLQYLLPRLP